VVLRDRAVLRMAETSAMREALVAAARLGARQY
jgi:hypothetical protein